jgi:hypothetical protein
MRSTGMEFAVEMIIKAAIIKARIGEVPITLRPDGRIDRKPHLRTFRDGWRTLCFFLLYGAKRLFLVHEIILIPFGVTESKLPLGMMFTANIQFRLQ